MLRILIALPCVLQEPGTSLLQWGYSKGRILRAYTKWADLFLGVVVLFKVGVLVVVFKVTFVERFARHPVPDLCEQRLGLGYIDVGVVDFLAVFVVAIGGGG